MENTTALVTEATVPDVLAELQAAFYDIPFENSQFQTEAFVISAQITPERAYRAIGLRMHDRVQAVLEAKHQRAMEDVDIAELRAKIENPATSVYDCQRAELEIQYKLARRPFADKLMNDALAELNVLYAHFQKLPRYDRAQFELGERAHFQEKLERQMKGCVGAAEALTNMTGDMPALTSYEEALGLLTHASSGGTEEPSQS